MIENVPQLVPVANEIRAAIKNTTRGKSQSGNPPLVTTSERKIESPSPPSDAGVFIIPPIVQASVSIISAGTIDFIPAVSAAHLLDVQKLSEHEIE